MKKVIIGLIAVAGLVCAQCSTKESSMKQATIIEMVMWKSAEGVSKEDAKKAMVKLNDFVSEQPGFVGRKTGLAKDGRFLDLVYWTDLKSAKAASEKAMKTESLAPIFSTIDQKQMQFQHFEIFNVKQ